jgi:signal transduction histidine kinase
VLINFILNAVEAMEGEEPPAAGTTGNGSGRTGKTLEIEVKSNKAEHVVEIHFRDNGPGISETVKSHLFEPFVSTKEAKGVGLGLYISYKIIDLHKGEIIYDEHYREGAHFTVKLPEVERCSNGG